MKNELKNLKDSFVKLLVAVAVYICPHEWTRVGTRWEECKHICLHCGTTGWQYKDDVTYEQHFISRLKREANVPKKAADVLFILERDLNRYCKSYKWTEDDSVALGKELYRAKVVAQSLSDDGKTYLTSSQILENAFMSVVVPKYQVEDYGEIKFLLDKLKPYNKNKS